jgi:hypothetical protein
MTCHCQIHRHCERSEAIQCSKTDLDCFVASFLAMTKIYAPFGVRSRISVWMPQVPL